MFCTLFSFFCFLFSVLSCFVSHFAYFAVFSTSFPFLFLFCCCQLPSARRINIMMIFMIFIMFHYVAFYDSSGSRTKRESEREKEGHREAEAEAEAEADRHTWPGHISAVCGYGCGYTMHSVRFSSNLWHVCLLFPSPGSLFFLCCCCCCCCCYCCYLLLGLRLTVVTLAPSPLHTFYVRSKANFVEISKLPMAAVEQTCGPL